jgi:hypothetical protein
MGNVDVLGAQEGRDGPQAARADPAPGPEQVHRDAGPAQLVGEGAFPPQQAHRHAKAGGVQPRQLPQQHRLDAPDVHAEMKVRDVRAMRGLRGGVGHRAIMAAGRGCMPAAAQRGVRTQGVRSPG